MIALSSALRKRAAVLLIGVCGLVGVLTAPASASAATTPFIYWSNNGNGTIGRANLDGTGVNQSFITGVTSVLGMGIDGQNIFFGYDPGFPSIGEASLNGTGVTQFVAGNSPDAIATNSQHLYWGAPGSTTVGRANLDGTGVDQSFITGANSTWGVAVDGQYIYWANNGTGTIGRANLDGTGVDQSFITGVGTPAGIAVSNQYIYWTTYGGNSIGRANLDGTGVDQSFITGVGAPTEIAVSNQYIYWVNGGSNSIGRANLDGTGVDQSFITGVDAPTGLAVSVPVIGVTPAAPSAFPATVKNSQSTPTTLTISNSGQQDLTISPSLTGSGSGDFKIASNNCPASITPGSSCQLSVVFAPVSQGTLSADLSIVSNDYADSPMSIPLTGTGSSTPSTTTRPAPTVKVTIKICRTIIHGDNDGDEGPTDEGNTITHRCVEHHVKVAKLRKLSGVATARIFRHHHLYAGGHARYLHGHWNVILTRRRVIHHGKYELIIRAKRHGHWIIQRRTIRL